MDPSTRWLNPPTSVQPVYACVLEETGPSDAYLRPLSKKLTVRFGLNDLNSRVKTVGIHLHSSSSTIYVGWPCRRKT